MSIFLLFLSLFWSKVCVKIDVFLLYSSVSNKRSKRLRALRIALWLKYIDLGFTYVLGLKSILWGPTHLHIPKRGDNNTNPGIKGQDLAFGCHCAVSLAGSFLGIWNTVFRVHLSSVPWYRSWQEKILVRSLLQQLYGNLLPKEKKKKEKIVTQV